MFGLVKTNCQQLGHMRGQILKKIRNHSQRRLLLFLSVIFHLYIEVPWEICYGQGTKSKGL